LNDLKSEFLAVNEYTASICDICVNTLTVTHYTIYHGNETLAKRALLTAERIGMPLHITSNKGCTIFLAACTTEHVQSVSIIILHVVLMYCY